MEPEGSNAELCMCVCCPEETGYLLNLKEMEPWEAGWLG